MHADVVSQHMAIALLYTHISSCCDDIPVCRVVTSGHMTDGAIAPCKVISYANPLWLDNAFPRNCCHAAALLDRLFEHEMFIVT